MAPALGFAIFFLVFIGALLGMHIYAGQRLFTLFGYKAGWWKWPLYAALMLSFFAASWIRGRSASLGAKLFYAAAATWIGIIFLLFLVLLVQHILSLFIKMQPATAGVAVLVIVGALVLFAIINAQLLFVRELEVQSPKVGREVRIVQLTDLHLGPLYQEGRLKEIVNRTNALKPDVVVVTGDMLDRPGSLDPAILAPLDDLQAPVLFTTGNHEHYVGLDTVEKLLAATKTRWLRNETADVAGVHFIGIDDHQQVKTELSKMDSRRLTGVNPKGFGGAVEGVNRSMLNVLLHHEPVGFEDAQRAGVDLMLTGHTHAGQIVPFNLLSKLVYPHNRGRFDLNGSTLYVSQGTGFWGPVMRLGTRNEITLVRVMPAGS